MSTENFSSPSQGEAGWGLPHALEQASNPHPNLPPERGKEPVVYKHRPRDQTLITYARDLRKNMTDVERKLWWHLRHEQLGAKFRRQYACGNYIADFACLEPKVIIELDGGQHAEQVAYDKKRHEFFIEQGFTMLRFWNNEVIENMGGVLTVILDTLKIPPLPNPLPQGERGLRDSL